MTVLLGACARSPRVDPGPDEFAVLPNAELSEPANYSDLPAPGGASMAAANPLGDAITALGGNAVTATQLGSGATTGGGGGGLFGWLFGGRSSEVLNADAEAKRLQSLGINVATIN